VTPQERVDELKAQGYRVIETGTRQASNGARDSFVKLERISGGNGSNIDGASFTHKVTSEHTVWFNE